MSNRIRTQLDPDTNRQLEKLCEAQFAARLNKEKLDKLKVNIRQKVDLLSASRSNLLSQGSIVDLLGAPSSQFPNPFDEHKTTEWDPLLSQCDIQQSNYLI
ncbi:hypothetical protein ANCDUO_23046 [Ancylostoma duodenale]|uniref:AH domain-containing protein n=1 Tax=Ancylostoma duodenale TaxID=51022 RepID=A0A0C2CAQ6_9BILA|nr:hypothetical protein ANCDUO_23046 [Ancylostoma duodenale]